MGRRSMDCDVIVPCLHCAGCHQIWQDLEVSCTPLAKLMGDYNAVKKGKIGQRVGRRVAGKATGKAMRKLST